VEMGWTGAYIASERFLLPETDSLLFMVGRAWGAHIVPEKDLSSCSHSFLRRVRIRCTGNVD